MPSIGAAVTITRSPASSIPLAKLYFTFPQAQLPPYPIINLDKTMWRFCAEALAKLTTDRGHRLKEEPRLASGV